MISCKVESGKVIDIAIGKIDGWIECAEGVGINWGYDGEEFTAPKVDPIERSTEEKIAALEASVTKRWLRGQALGDQFAISAIQAVEDLIQELRE